MIIFFQLLHVFILWLLKFSPYPELFIYPYLASNGFLPYRQILDQHFPGLMFLPVNFYTLGFQDPASFKVLLFFIIIITSTFIYRLGKSWIPVLAYTLWQPFFEGSQLWLDIFLPLFTLPAFYFYQVRSFILTGLFLGFGVVFKQTLIPLVAIIGLIILIRFGWRQFLKFSFSAGLAPMLMLGYFWHKHILADFWYWTVKFNLTIFAAQGSLHPGLTDLIKLSLPVIILVVCFWKFPKSRPLYLWLVFTVIGGIARFGFLHFQPAIPFLALIIGHLSANKKLLYTFICLSVLWQGAFLFRQTDWLQIQYFDKTSLSLADHISALAPRGSSIFLLGVDPHLYALTHTYPPGHIFVFQFPWFIRIAGDRVFNSLQTDPPRLIVYDPQSVVDHQYIRDYGSVFVTFINTRYHLVDHVGKYQIYLPNSKI